MHSSLAFRSVSTKAVVPRSSLVARRVSGRHAFQRLQSTTSTTGSHASSTTTHIAAGVAGGTAVLIGGYAWYHFSGVKNAVESARAVSDYYQQTKSSIVAKAPKDPNEALDYFRKVAHSYLVVIPGVRPHVDAVFDTIDDLRDSHGDEVNRIVTDGFEEVQVIVKVAGNVDMDTALKIFDVLRRRSTELQELGGKVGKDVFESLSQRYPQLSEKLGVGYDEFRRLAAAKGPEAKRLYEETSGQLREIFSKGFSQDGVDQAKQLIQSKTSELRKFAQTSSQDTWNRAMNEASTYLDKLPEIKQLLNENADKFISAGAVALSGRSSGVQEVFARIRDVAQSDKEKSKEKIKELRELVQTKAHEAEEQSSSRIESGWEGLQDWIRTIPGGEDALKRIPDVKVFVKVSQGRGEDAKKLAQETFEAVFQVLEEKGKKAKQLSEEVKEDAKKTRTS